VDKISSLSAIAYSKLAMVEVVSATWDSKEVMVSSQSAWLVALALSASPYLDSRLSMMLSIRMVISSNGALEAKFN
jgi:hypothetical protein